MNGINHRFKNHGFRISTRSVQEARIGKIENGTETPLAPQRPLCRREAGEREKDKREGNDGKGERAFPSSHRPLRAFFRVLLFFGGGNTQREPLRRREGLQI